ncbi:hypothetical protein [Amycolatopsis sp. NPDC004079]|uniref:hypothetical protein n=1 Tax=Amycolatopsis sp. NPDC004079 TaxID=3154549 RepID=UPI0033BDAD82
MIIPECAMTALMSIASSRRQSRDSTIRQLLEVHVRDQELRKPGNRLTHVSTVLRYPPAPLGRRHRSHGIRLRLRLPLGLTERARTVSLSLPGQSLRARKDYQARQLTDAVMTAIATVSPFSDNFLRGLPPLLLHCTAIRLWQAAVAATCTTAERDLINEAYQLRLMPTDSLNATHKRLLRIATALESDVAWHSPQRFEIAAKLARAWFRGPEAPRDQTPLHLPEEDWNEELQDLRNRLQDTSGGYNWSGRGATAVWRAHRLIEMQDFAQWLIGRTSSASTENYRINLPGWLVSAPAGWCARALREPVEEPFASWLTTGRLLTFSHSGLLIAWPLRQADSVTGWEPVSGLEPIVAAAKRIPSSKIVSFVEAILLTWNAGSTEQRKALEPPLQIFVDKAFEFGFIDADEMRAARAKARSETVQQMRSIVDHLSPEHTALRPELAAAIGKAREFTALAKTAGITFHIVRATWAWPLTTVVEEALSGQRTDAVEWLAGAAYRHHNRQLQRSMEAAWQRAFDH